MQKLDAVTGNLLASWEQDTSPRDFSLKSSLYAFYDHRDRNINILDDTGKVVKKLFQEYRATNVKWLSNGIYLAASWEVYPIINIWDTSTGKIVTTYRKHMGVNALGLQDWDCSPSSTWIASIQPDKHGDKVNIWEATTGKTIATPKQQSQSAQHVKWSPDGKWIALWSSNVIQVVNANNGKPVASRTLPDRIWPTLEWSPDSKQIITLNDYTLHILQASSGNIIQSFKSSNRFWRISWAPDGTRIASISIDNNSNLTKCVDIWKSDTVQKIYTYSGHSDGLYGFAWSPDGTRIISVSRKEVKLWQAV